MPKDTKATYYGRCINEWHCCKRLKKSYKCCRLSCNQITGWFYLQRSVYWSTASIVSSRNCHQGAAPFSAQLSIINFTAATEKPNKERNFYLEELLRFNLRFFALSVDTFVFLQTKCYCTLYSVLLHLPPPLFHSSSLSFSPTLLPLSLSHPLSHLSMLPNENKNRETRGNWKQG